MCYRGRLQNVLILPKTQKCFFKKVKMDFNLKFVFYTIKINILKNVSSPKLMSNAPSLFF